MTPTLASHDSAEAESPAFLHAVAELAQRRAVVTARAVYNLQGAKLVDSGVSLDAALVGTLQAQPLAMRLDECVATDDAIDAARLRKAAADAIRSLPFFAAMAPDDESREALLDAVAAIPLPAPVAFQLTLARETSFEQFDHGVLMALLCAHLVRGAGASADDMAAAAAAGLLHDLGMLHIDPELLKAGHRLSSSERRPLYVHPITSAMLVDRFEVYPQQVMRAIIEHHEQLDGSGYPQGLAGNAISPLGRVLSLAEVVTAMFDGKRQYPEQRVSLMLRISPRRFDATSVAAVQRLLATLPAPVDEPGPGVAESVQRLQLLAGLLAEWHDALDQTTPDLDDTSRSVLRSFAEQADALQSMLFDAGITAEQLGMLTSGAESDPALRVELWALAQELQWNLIASAHQLQRRWEGFDADQPIPEALAAWGDTVWALDTLA
ncbi:MAG: HD domain-containing phosphohydrolase [Burkholderiales bacterium]|nr:HD domain-containing phosphohydrolase [Burkholderiales bacterium]